MMIQSLSKTPTSTRVVILDVAPGTSDRAILSACGPIAHIDHTIRRTDDFTGEITRQAASVVFWTD
jgi:hypothetical protein